jgi:DNA invertase Pin-like site-specific DNA recombinase
VVTRLDRLARSTRDLLNVLEAVKQAGAGFRSLKDAWCDTTTPHGEQGRSALVFTRQEFRQSWPWPWPLTRA